MYSTNVISGKCIKCLAEQKLDDCLRALLRSEETNIEWQHKYEALLTFLQSPESNDLREECERLLAEGKQVKIRLNFNDGKLVCNLKVE